MRCLVLVELFVHVTCENCLFMGHSFFAPIARRIPNFAPPDLNHTQHVISRGGSNGLPSSLWKAYGTRREIQARLNEGDVDLLGMTLDRDTGETELDALNTTEYYELWIEYALEQNPRTQFMIGIPWPDFPLEYNTSVYTRRYKEILPYVINVLTRLYNRYPDVAFITNPYGLGVMELRLLFEQGMLSDEDVSFLRGPASNSIFRDDKGHAGAIAVDLLALFFVNRIYGVSVADVSLAYRTDVGRIAQTVLDQYDAGNLCDDSSCYVKHTLPPASPTFPEDGSTSCSSVRQEYRSNQCCGENPATTYCNDLKLLWRTRNCCDP